MTDSRFGFACKFLPEESFDNKKDHEAWLSLYNLKGTTATALMKQFSNNFSPIGKIISIIRNNIQVLCNQMHLVGSWPVGRRMLRIGSDLFPCFTHPSLKDLYNEYLVRAEMDKLSVVGDLARQYDIRLSMHPGQYTMLFSNSPNCVKNSIADLEYHAEIFRLMGYTSSDLRQEINIHGGARSPNFVEEFLKGYSKLAVDTQRWLSVENDENSYGLDDLLPLASKVKICLDINHYWIKEGDYIDHQDPRLQTVIDSWGGVRPEMHVAYPQENLLCSFGLDTLPHMPTLLERKIKKQSLRAHSYGAWNSAITKYALGFSDRFDLMFEGKSKNLAAKVLYETAHLC